MSRNRFTSADTERIPISDGDWIEVKADLNNGDTKKMLAAGLKPPIRVNGELITPIDFERYEIERALVSLVAWSLPVPISFDSLKAMNPEDFEEVNQVIFDYRAKKADEKNARRAT